MSEQSGGEALVQSLIQNGVETLFALPGVQLDAFFNALYDARDRIRVITPRHEQGAGYMALGYSLASGDVGAYAVVPGVGLLNTFAALATAYTANARVLAIAAEIPSALIGKGWGLLHEIPDQLGMMRHLTKWAERIDHPREVPAKVGEAFRQLRGGRPRPVGLEMPMDRLFAVENVAPAGPFAPEPPPEPDPAQVRAAAARLGAAKRPLILAGGGVFGAEEELQALAEALQAPVSTHWMGRGTISAAHPLAVVDPVGRELWPQADVVLALGTRLYHQRTMWTQVPGQTHIAVNLDTEDLANTGAELALRADAKLTLRALLAELPKHNRARKPRAPEIGRLRKRVERGWAKTLGPQVAWLRAIRRALDPDGIFVDELTQIGYVSRFALPVYRPRSYLCCGNQGTLGWGFATALGAKVARPDCQVLAVAGDGGFLYTASELATAVHFKIPVVAVVFNDGAYGNVKRMQEQDYGGRVLGSELTNPDFVRFAKSFGAAGYRAKSPRALERALADAFKQNVPAVIEVPMGDVPDPWATLLGQDVGSAMRLQRK